jgi:hypothetical protein
MQTMSPAKNSSNGDDGNECDSDRALRRTAQQKASGHCKNRAGRQHFNQAQPQCQPTHLTKVYMQASAEAYSAAPPMAASRVLLAVPSLN